MTSKRLVRPRRGRRIAGVAAGVADRFGVSRFLVRVAFVVFGLVGAGEIVYLALWLLMPKEAAPEVAPSARAGDDRFVSA